MPTPQPHSHKSPGDGGKLHVPEIVASGTVTVAADSVEWVNYDGEATENVDAHVTFADAPGASAPYRLIEDSGVPSTDDTHYDLYWESLGGGRWELGIRNGDSASQDYNWAILRYPDL